MEILGIVWAASIINQSSPAPSEMELASIEPQRQQPVSVEGTVSWFTSLAQAYGWEMIDSGPPIPRSEYVFNTSWLVSNLSNTDVESGISSATDATEPHVFPLFPVISQGLSGIESALVSSPMDGDSEPVVASSNWENWDVVAAVRIVESAQPGLAEANPPHFDAQCVTEPAVPYQAASTAMTVPQKLQVWVHDHFIGEMNNRLAAQNLVDKFRFLMQEGKLEPSHLRPLFGANFVGGSLQSEILFVVDEAMRSHPEVPAAAIAVQWINNLRVALDEAPLNLVQVQMAMDGLRETSQVIYGSASWYGPGFHGRKTANGERFDENTLTAAHKTLPFNTRLKVTNRLNGKSVVVRINDRGPYIGNRTLDLSKAAAQCLGGIGTGVIPYEAVFLESAPKPELDELTTAQVRTE
ncbi:MAG: septal ring lytic transglycosylase RlpA family protein [Cyanobacteria bacterium P01_F01_bin.86]